MFDLAVLHLSHLATYCYMPDVIVYYTPPPPRPPMLLSTCPILTPGPAEQHDPPGGHQVPPSGVAVVWDVVQRWREGHR